MTLPHLDSIPFRFYISLVIEEIVCLKVGVETLQIKEPAPEESE